MKKRTFQKSIALQSRFHEAIPGGAHTYAKGDDQFPEFCPPIIAKGLGSHVWDVDGNEYIEYGMGLRSVGLGHAYPPIIFAAYRQMQLGSNYSRPANIELKAAEKLLSLVPGADMVKFAKNGSDATTAAIKLARAHTGRKKVAICGDHPFFSVNDWFIGATKINNGIPKEISSLTLKFEFNNLASVQRLFDEYPNEIACFIMEPEKYQPVELDFLFGLQKLCKKYGAVFILDEMITGFRWHIGGAQTMYGIEPDLSTFGKAMGNGFAIAALLGKKEIMELGGLRHDRERVFLLSTTHGAENHSLAASLAVIEEYEKDQVIDYFKYQGERLRKGIKQSIAENHLEGYVDVIGHPACMVFSTKDQNKKPYSQTYRTLLLQELIKRGVIAPNLVISFSHKDKDIDRTVEIFHEVLGIYRKAIDE
ncbi:MAG TPA: glutamate-1-semialdehyde 2,1-aminomutase, partial [Saprospiraceae bacterium]|nr:glutamate-1-semialdehyde 2,1-aminomutase [Saprospiraceae bacterium]